MSGDSLYLFTSVSLFALFDCSLFSYNLKCTSESDAIFDATFEEFYLLSMLNDDHGEDF